MKKFLKKIAVLALICTFLTGAANLAFYVVRGSLTPEYVDRFLNVPQGIQVANLGNSHGQSGFQYAHHPELVSANFAFGSQNLILDEKMLLNFLDRFQSGATLYIPVTYPSLVPDSSSRSDFLSLNRRYYYFMKPSLIIDFSLREWITVKLPGLFVPNWTAGYWRTDEFAEVAEQTADMIDLAADSKAAVERHITNWQQDGTYILNQENTDCLHRLISICKEKDINPVLVTTPFLREYNDLVPEDFLLIQRTFLNALADESGIPYLDYSQDARFVDRHDLFLNCDHLNDSGGLLFTNLLLAEANPIS